MPHEDPLATPEEPLAGDRPTIHDAPTAATAVHAEAIPAPAPGLEPMGEPAAENLRSDEDDDDWLDESEELPHRPRRRLLKTGGDRGGNPIFLALLGVLLIACGFIGGVLIEKGQTSSSSTSGAGAGASGLASRFRALREGASGASGTGSTSASGSPSSLGGFTRPTAGTVAYLDGSTLYVTNAEGNTVKVTTSAGTTVSKTVSSTVHDIHPGESVTITGATGASGVLSAESISVGSSLGGLASLFGGSGGPGTGGSGSATTAGGGSSGSSGSGGSGGGGSGSSGEPALFGK